MFEDSIKQAVEIIAKADYAIAFTGAGISAESGIPTFRDPGGIWDRFDPDEIGSSGGLMAFAARNPERIRDFLRESVNTFKRAEPNPGHYSLAVLEEMGILKSIITQNIDALHTVAGNSRVFEVHGNLYRFRCASCDYSEKIDRQEILKRMSEVLQSDAFNLDRLLGALPSCGRCSNIMRPDVVMFGEAVLQMEESMIEAFRADVVIIAGTSGVVYPAASVPIEAKRSRAKVIEINSTENAFRGITDVYVSGSCGSALPKIMELIRGIKG